MSLPKHLESKAPTESWWVNKSRAAFADAQAAELERMRLIGAYVVAGFDTPKSSQRMSKPTRERGAE